MNSAGEDGDDAADVVAFPFSRVRPVDSAYRDLGITALARHLGLQRSRLSGHWCKRCQGIWFGTLLEAECPVCGNRSG